ncbi:MAG: xanthine permease [Brevinemataceae bacterium]
MNTQTTPWFVKGDLNGFFGLFTNSLTNIMTALSLLVIIGMDPTLVFKKIAPALVLAVGLGNIYMAWAAKRLANKTNHENITALPYGVSVPHYFIVSFGVLAGTVSLLSKDSTMSMEQVWLTAWGVGAAWSFVQGIIMLIGAFIGTFIQKYIPKIALLGSLAGLAITFIAMNPAANIFMNPVVGMTTLSILMVGWLANKKLPFNLPAGFLAIVVGAIMGWSLGLMDSEDFVKSFGDVGFSIPQNLFGYFVKGFGYLAPFLPAAIPLGIYDFLESLDNVESAHTSGEHYNTMEMLLVPALLTLVTAPIGNIFPTIIYIGHPGWKAAGARVGYSIATGVGVILLGVLGGISIIGRSIPLVALVPILVYIATVIGKQAFGSTNKKYYPALIIGIMPFIASYLMLQINTILGNLGLSANDIMGQTSVPLFGFIQFGSADILVSMMLISITTFAIARSFKKAAMYCLVASVLSYFGFIHSSVFKFSFYIPEFTTSVVWGYVGMAIVFLIAAYFQPETNVEPADE